MTKKHLLICTLLFLIPFSNLAQKGSNQPKSPYQRAIELGEVNFKQGNYAKALNAYNFALNLLYVSEDKKVIEQRVKQITGLLASYRDMYRAFNNENYTEALGLINKIRRLNPNDPRISSLEQKVKTIAGVPVPPPKNAQTPSDRWIAKAKNLIKAGDLPGASRLIATLPPSQTKKSMMEQIAILESQPKPNNQLGFLPSCEDDKRKYIVLKFQMNKSLETCELQSAKKFALNILSLNCYKSDSYTRNKLSIINETQSKLREIESLKSGGGGQSAETFIAPIYKTLQRINKKCVENEYFYYVFELTERISRINPCNKELLIKYQELISISKDLATKENILGKIKAIEDCSTCDNKELILIRLLQEGKVLYSQCRYEEALQKHKLGIEYRCSNKELPILTEWESVIKPEILNNFETTVRFVALKSSADSLMALQECSKALNLYREAELLSTNCVSLKKSDLTQKIAFAECCATAKDVTVLVDSSRRAKQLGYFMDACRFLNEAIKLSESNNCINLERKTQLLEEQKIVCCRAYPDRKECKEDTDTTKSGSTFSLGIYSSSFMAHSTYSSDLRTPSPYIGWGGYSAGIMGTLSDKKPLEIGLGIGIASSFYYIKSDIGLTDKLSIQSVDIPIDIILFLTRKKKSIEKRRSVFIYGSTALQIPIKFDYTNYITGVELNSSKYANELLFAFRAGLGYSLKKLSSSLFYETASNPVSKQSIADPIGLSGIGSNRIGIELKYRLFRSQSGKKPPVRRSFPAER